MKIYTTKSAIFVALSLLLHYTQAHASKLTFDISSIADGRIIDQTYGNNITATTMGAFSYGSDQGFTPNVTLNYGPNSPQLWTKNFGNLTNLLQSSRPDPQLLVLTFTAEAGFNVRLHSFDLAGWTPGFNSEPTINSVSVLDGANNILFSQSNPVISITSSTPFTFGTPLTGQVLKIQIDATNIDADDIGIDNIIFSQVSTPADPLPDLIIDLIIGQAVSEPV